MSDEMWDSGNYTFQSHHYDINTATLGSFASFFGEDHWISIFTMTWETATGITQSTAQDDQFYLVDGFLFSEFAAFNGTQLIDYSLAASSNPSNPTPVPEPSTLAVFVIGFLGICSRRVKKQTL